MIKIVIGDECYKALDNDGLILFILQRLGVKSLSAYLGRFSKINRKFSKYTFF